MKARVQAHSAARIVTSRPFIRVLKYVPVPSGVCSQKILQFQL